MSASNIGGDYNWSAKGWQVKFDPTMDELKAGCIVNYEPSGNNIWGHTAVITRVGGGSYDIIEQNYNYKLAHSSYEEQVRSKNKGYRRLNVTRLHDIPTTPKIIGTLLENV